MSVIYREYAWDAIIPAEGVPTIVLPCGELPCGALSTRSGVFIRRTDGIYHLSQSESLGARISSYDQIIVAEADEALSRQTKIRHHWQELTITME